LVGVDSISLTFTFIRAILLGNRKEFIMWENVIKPLLVGLVCISVFLGTLYGLAHLVYLFPILVKVFAGIFFLAFCWLCGSIIRIM